MAGISSGLSSHMEIMTPKIKPNLSTSILESIGGIQLAFILITITNSLRLFTLRQVTPYKCASLRQAQQSLAFLHWNYGLWTPPFILSTPPLLHSHYWIIMEVLTLASLNRSLSIAGNQQHLTLVMSNKLLSWPIKILGYVFRVL